MSEVIRLEDRRLKSKSNNKVSAIIKKLVDGQLIECVNLDMLSPEEQWKFLSQNN